MVCLPLEQLHNETDAIDKLAMFTPVRQGIVPKQDVCGPWGYYWNLVCILCTCYVSRSLNCLMYNARLMVLTRILKVALTLPPTSWHGMLPKQLRRPLCHNIPTCLISTPQLLRPLCHNTPTCLISIPQLLRPLCHNTPTCLISTPQLLRPLCHNTPTYMPHIHLPYFWGISPLTGYNYMGN